MGNYLNKCLPILGKLGDRMSRMCQFLDKKVVDDLEPEWYIKMGLCNVSEIVDGNDFLC